MMSNKIRVALVCHLCNKEIRERIHWCRHGSRSDFAVWNTVLISELAKRDDIELHVIAPMNWMRSVVQTFSIGRVNYYFYKTDVPLLHVSWRFLLNFDVISNYWLTRKIVQRWIRKIDPDIVNLIGAENPYYSASILGLKGYPVLVSIQGIYSNPERFKAIKEDHARTKFERMVHAQNKYYGVSAYFMPALIDRDAKNAVYVWNRFPTPIQRSIEDESCRCKLQKSYDFVQFSRLNDTKGVPDTIRATAIVRQEFPDVKVRIFGGASAEYLRRMETLIDELGLCGNVYISGGYATHKEVIDEASQARNYILPTYIDTIPTTLFEATGLGLAIVSYKTGDIPKLNVGEERVLLAERGNVNDLATQMLRLMRNDGLGEELNTKARKFIEKYFSNEANVEQHVNSLKAVIANWRYGKKIPEELLYEGYLERQMQK